MRLRDIEEPGCYFRLIQTEEGENEPTIAGIERMDIVAFVMLWCEPIAALLRIPVTHGEKGLELIDNERLLDRDDGGWERLFDAGQHNELSIADTVRVYRFAGMDDKRIADVVRTAAFESITKQIAAALAAEPPPRGAAVRVGNIGGDEATASGTAGGERAT